MISKAENISVKETFWDFKGKDTAVDSWPFMGNPLSVTLILIGYLLMVAVGPKMMKNRPPFNLDRLMIFYNGLQILMAGSLCLAILSFDIFNHPDGILYSGCNYSKDTHDILLLKGTYFYFICKITELLDTLFFILRKKNNQLTVLHVFHHGTMVAYMWSYLKYASGGDGAVLAFLNCFVHVVMYIYYLLAGLGPKFQKFLWWKKYVTELQLAQFCIMLFYLVWNYGSPKCQFSKAYNIFVGTNITIYLTLFLNFYINSYKKGKSKKN